MPLKKLLSLRHWSHLFKRAGRLLMSPGVPLTSKLLYLVPVLLYWVLPDVLPFMPIDDIAVTMFLTNAFTKWMENKYPQA
ncbi:hypothetical protein [Paenibacillus sp. FJAT-26967]|uniref:hypothetical protein n=1 Tax=Paenibacillus sp. FJAT-26967 TaxID=1729690 RepID=UPI0015611F9A|nr:hypothetical protein [Paenibacillus sp. FJAT-26967]